jgi:hypothetical protein
MTTRLHRHRQCTYFESQGLQFPLAVQLSSSQCSLAFDHPWGLYPLIGWTHLTAVCTQRAPQFKFRKSTWQPDLSAVKVVFLTINASLTESKELGAVALRSQNSRIYPSQSTLAPRRHWWDKTLNFLLAVFDFSIAG